MRCRKLWILLILFAFSGCIESNPQPSPLGDSRQQADTQAEADNGTPGGDAVIEPDTSIEEDVIQPGDVIVSDVAGDSATDLGNDVPVIPEGCCEEDKDCPSADEFCYTNVTGMGVCLAKPGTDQCWSNQECSEGKLCLGPIICTCGSNCPLEERFGLCVGQGYPCCETDDQCPSTQTCRNVTFNGGKKGSKCLGEKPETGCWNNGDCPKDSVCADYYIKPCSEPSIGGDVAGICVPFQSSCCTKSDECAWGKVCIGASDDMQGACVSAPVYPSCYSDAQCGGLGTCVGGQSCGCAEDCSSIQGTCEQPTLCCQTDLDCDAGLICVGQSIYGGGFCVAAPEAGSCYGQAHCAETEVCMGQVLCGCMQNCVLQAGSCQTLPEGCCKSSESCPAESECVFPFGGAQQEVGVCRTLPELGSCWNDQGCEAEEVCLGVVVCPCGQTCESENPGICLPASEQICCELSADCPMGWVCAGEKEGVCKPAPLAGQCWQKSDCGLAQACDFVSLCPCGQQCPFDDQIGTCNYYMPYNCCITDFDCKDGSHCVPMGPGKLGRCMWSDEWSGGCWSDSECAEGQSCNGEFICGCDQYCTIYETQGQCGTPPADGCCYSAMDCGDGMACTGDVGVAGSCVPKAQFGQCWTGSDCYWTQSCQGVVAPKCGELAEPVAGECSPMPSNCCWKDVDCPTGRVCRNQGYSATDLPGMCLWDPKGPACPEGDSCCWNDSDCPPESWCSGASGCACLELCQGCGTCNDLKAGTCIPWGGPKDPLPWE